MGWLFIAVVCASWAYAGFQHAALPAGTEPVSEVLGLAIAASLAVVWWHGRCNGRARAFAAAYARAEARATASAMAGATATNAVQIIVGDGARAVAAREGAALDGAEWIGEPRALLEQDADVDGESVDLRELLEDGEVIEAT